MDSFDISLDEPIFLMFGFVGHIFYGMGSVGTFFLGGCHSFLRFR